MTTPFPENQGWPYVTDGNADYNLIHRFPEWSQLLAQKLYQAIGAGEPAPGDPVMDTGWITDPIDLFTPQSGITVDKFSLRRSGVVVSVAVRFSYNRTISVPSDGDINNVNVGQFQDPRFIPDTPSEYQGLNAGAVGRALSGGIYSNGIIALGAVAGSSNVGAGTGLALMGTYLV